MSQTPSDIVIASLAFMALWIVAVLVILIAGQYSPRVGEFRRRMLAQWKPALGIGAAFLIGMGMGGRGWFNLYAPAVFCQAWIGLAIAADLPDFQPLPVAQAIIERRQMLRQAIFLIVISVVVIVPALLIGTIGLDIGRHLFGEMDTTQTAANSLPPNKWLAFFLLFSGAGLAEETPYRLVLLSLIWKWSRRSGLAIVLSALVFGAYHLTPLSGMYRTFWQFPVSQFIASTLIGLVWGYLFVKRGFETAVLGHTFSDWLPLLLFAG